MAPLSTRKRADRAESRLVVDIEDVDESAMSCRFTHTPRDIFRQSGRREKKDGEGRVLSRGGWLNHVISGKMKGEGKSGFRLPFPGGDTNDEGRPWRP